MDKLNELSNEKNIIIFGAGFTGKFVLKKLRNRNINVDAFCDNVIDGEVEGIKVYKLSDLKSKFYCNMIFIISVRDIQTIVFQLKKEGLYNYYAITSVYNLDEISSELSFMEKQKLEAAWYAHRHFLDDESLNLDTLDLVITERCSLRCRECSNLMQYYSKPIDYSLNDIKRDVERTLTFFKEIYEVRLIGGEPFMHKDLGEIILYLNRKENIRRICVYTNATIPLNNRLISAINYNQKTWFSISDYGGLSKNIEKLIAALDNNNIGYERKKIDYWTRCSSFGKNDRCIEEQKKVFYECCAKSLVTLLRGKIYPCPFIANAMNLNAIPSCLRDYVDLRSDNNEKIKSELEKLLKNRDFYESCDYCAGRPSVAFVKEKDKIVPCEQIHNPMEYERYIH